MFNTRNKFHISAQPCNILYIVYIFHYKKITTGYEYSINLAKSIYMYRVYQKKVIQLWHVIVL